MKYACIARQQREFPVRLMCRLLAVSPAGFYAAQRRAPSARAGMDQRLRLAIRAAHAASHRCYGAPKIHAELQAQGIRCGRKRIARLMRLDGLRGVMPRRYRVTTHSRHAHPVVPNHLARRFHPRAFAYPRRDQAWAADITYLRTGEGWLYLAVLLDVGTRRVIGWCADRHLGQALTLRPLLDAVAVRRPGPGLIHHSDRGQQYASVAYQRVLQQHGIIPSMSRVGDCWDNAVVESFFAMLKRELLAHARWPTRRAAQQHLQWYIESWYNSRRRHATLGFLSPYQYERELLRVRND